MDLSLSPEVEMLRTEIRRFVDDELRPAIDDAYDRVERYHDLDPAEPDLVDNVQPHPIKLPEAERTRLRNKAKESGFWAMGVPEEYGGGGLDMVERCVVLEELSKHRMGLYQAGLGVVELGPGLTVGEPAAYLEWATDYQYAEFFEPCIEGTAQSAFALTEPAAGSDPRGMETTATKDGDEWVIDGQKHFITFADDADFLILAARTGPQGDLVDHGITMFLVPTDLPGVDVARAIPVIRPEYPFEIHLDGVRVPAKNVVGEVGEGLALAKQCLDESRILYAANSLGPVDQAIRMGIEWANDREVGGKPLAERQAIQWKIAESAIDYRDAKFNVYRAAWLADQDEDVRHAASVAKYRATSVLWDVLDRMVQIHGGMGVSADLPLERWLREARVRRIGEGPDEVHLKSIARNLLKGYEDPDPFA